MEIGMRMAPIGSYVCLLDSQVVVLLGEGLGDVVLEEVCHLGMRL